MDWYKITKGVDYGEQVFWLYYGEHSQAPTLIRQISLLLQLTLSSADTQTNTKYHLTLLQSNNKWKQNYAKHLLQSTLGDTKSMHVLHIVALLYGQTH